MQNRGIRESTSGEHVQQRHQTFAGLRLELLQSAGIDARQDDERAETVYRDKKEGDEDSRPQILNPPNVLDCFD